MPITVLNLPRWALRTAIADREHYLRSEPARNSKLAWRVIASLRPPLRRPIFVVGAPRSGTTFLGECIAALPEVSYHYEPIATKAAVRCVYNESWSERRARFFWRGVYRWLERIHFDGDRRFADKTPRNCFIIEFLHCTFPDARFLHILRDGRDAALSHRAKPWLRFDAGVTGEVEAGMFPVGAEPRFWVEPERRGEFRKVSDLHRCIWTWRRHVESVVAAAAALPTEKYHEIRYEALVADPGSHSVSIADFLGIRREASRNRLRDSLHRANPGSVGRWRGEMTAAERQVVEAEAGGLLRRLGYTSPQVDRAAEPAGGVTP